MEESSKEKILRLYESLKDNFFTEGRGEDNTCRSLRDSRHCPSSEGTLPTDRGPVDNTNTTCTLQSGHDAEGGPPVHPPGRRRVWVLEVPKDVSVPQGE